MEVFLSPGFAINGNKISLRVFGEEEIIIIK